MHRTEHGNVIIQRFDGVADLVREHDKPSVANKVQQREITNYTHGTDWYGVPEARQVLPTIQKGAPAARAAIEKLSKQFSLKTAKGKRVRRKAIRTRQGDELDIHAVKSGNLDRAWRATERIKEKKGKAKRVTIIYQTGANCDKTAGEIFYTPAVATVLAEKLNNARMAIEIFSVCCGHNVLENGKHVIQVVRVKNPKHPLNIGSLAVTAFAGYFRYLIFSAYCLEEEKATDYLGRAENFYQNHPDLCKSLVKENARMVWVPPIYSEAEAVNFINKVIKDIEENVEQENSLDMVSYT